MNRVDREEFPFGIYLGIGAAAVVVMTTVAAVLPAHDSAARLAVPLAAVVGCALVIPDARACFVVAVIAYLLFNGFLVNRYGELTWAGVSGLWEPAAFLIAASTGISGRKLTGAMHSRTTSNNQ